MKAKWAIGISAGVIVVSGVIYWVVSWSAAREWEALVARLEAEGETLVMEELFAPTLPEAENFFGIPLLRVLGLVEGGDVETGPGAEARARLDAVDFRADAEVPGLRYPPSRFGYAFGNRRDLVATEAYLRGAGTIPLPENKTGPAAILDGLEAAHGEIFAELASGLDRSGAQYLPPLAEVFSDSKMYYAVPLPHYNVMTTLTKTLSLRADAAIAAGDAARARESLEISFRLMEAARRDRNLLSQLIAVTELTITMGPVWGALEARIFGEEDLEWLEGELGKIEHLDGLIGSLRVEMAGLVETVDGVATGSGGGVVPQWMRWSAPMLGGVIVMNKTTCVEWLYDYHIAPLKEGGFLGMIARQDEFERVRDEMTGLRRVRSFFALIAIPTYGSVGQRMIYSSAIVEQARVAVGLERHFLERGAYPRSLEDLVPDFLEEVPLDPIDGAPLRYLRYVEGGRCRLWSVGWDGEDDGGVRVLDEEKPERMRFFRPDYLGDWVWSYAP